MFWDLSTSAFFCFHVYMTFLLHKTSEVLEVRGCVHVCSVGQLYLTLCDPMGSNPSGSSVHGILQARVFEWVAMSSSRESSQTGDQTHVSCISCTAGRFFTHWVTWEALCHINLWTPFAQGFGNRSCSKYSISIVELNWVNLFSYKWSCSVVSKSLQPHGL